MTDNKYNTVDHLSSLFCRPRRTRLDAYDLQRFALIKQKLLLQAIGVMIPHPRLYYYGTHAQ